MHIRTICQALLKKRGHTYRSIAKVIGVTHGAINSLIKVGNPNTDTLLKHLAPQGYAVAIVPVGSHTSTHRIPPSYPPRYMTSVCQIATILVTQKHT